MRKLYPILLLAGLMACDEPTIIRYHHQVIVTYKNDTKDTVNFHGTSNSGRDINLPGGCVYWLDNSCFHVLGAEEEALGRCDVKKIEHSILDTTITQTK